MIQAAEGAIIITEHSNTETSFIASLLCFHTWECLEGARLRQLTGTHFTFTNW
jgi:hypothetical protein